MVIPNLVVDPRISINGFERIERNLKSDKKSTIKISEKNLKINEYGYICINVSFNGKQIRISTKLKYSRENYVLALKNAQVYISKYLREKGYSAGFEYGYRQPDEAIHDSLLYILKDMQGDVKSASIDKIESFIKIMKKDYPCKQTNAINEDWIKDQAAYWHNKGYSASVIKYRVSMLKRAINGYREHFGIAKLADRISVSNLGKRAKITKIFTQEELRKILGSDMSCELRAYVMIAIYTGARVGEILALARDDIDLDSEYITIERTKAPDGCLNIPKTQSSVRKIPIFSSEFKRFLIDFVKGKQYALFNITRGKLDYQWKKLLKKAGLDYRKLYSLRHTFATLNIAGNNNILAVSSALGHANSAITLKTYAKNQVLALEDVMFKV